MKKRRLVLAIWIVILIFGLPSAVYAYIDPATTTYLIQIVAAVAISLGVVVSIVVYRIRAVLTNLRMGFYRLQIRLRDGSAGSAGNKKAVKSAAVSAKPVREVFPAIVRPGDLEKLKAGMPEFLRTPENTAAEAASRETIPAETGAGKWKALWRDDRVWPKRLLAAALVFCAIAFTFFVFAPIDLTVSNASMLPFTFADIQNETLLIALIVAAVPTVILTVLRGRVFDFFLCGALALLTAGYVQGNFLNSGLGTMTGDTVAWNDMTQKTLINLCIWIGIFIFFYALRYFTKKGWRATGLIVPAAIIAIQLVALGSLLNTGLPGQGAVADPTQGIQGLLTDKGLTDVSSKSNIIVIVLDRLDDDNVTEIMNENPDFFAPMDGFTHYNNFVTHYSATMPSIPEFFTGQRCWWDRPQTTWLNEAWSAGTFLPELRAQGYSVRLYTEKGQVYDDIHQLMGLADNTSAGKLSLDSKAASKRILELSAYRFAPYALKPSFWIPANDFGHLVYSEDKESQPYKFDDIQFYKQLNSDGLKISTDQNNFAFYHLQGPHDPIIYDENVQYSADSTVIRQAEGGFKIVYDMIDQMKKLGLYDNATIIVMGDHGWPDDPSQPKVEYPTLAGLFVKPAGSAGMPVAESNAPVASENLRATIMQAAGGNPAKYGVPVDQVPADDQTPRDYYWKWPSGGGKNHLLVYNVIGDGRDIANWHYVRSIENIPYNY
ncbi:MAG: sulfatase-like hydrolase/transferase [Clostridiales bacterium]|nr:sulfatase-like hydrolase/transferase [Clostridiales bacterium]